MAIFSTLPEHWQNEFGKFLFQGELNIVKCKTFKCLVMGSAAAGCCLLSVIKSSSPVPRLCPFIFTGCGLWMDLPDPFFWSRAGLHFPPSPSAAPSHDELSWSSLSCRFGFWSSDNWPGGIYSSFKKKQNKINPTWKNEVNNFLRWSPQQQLRWVLPAPPLPLSSQLPPLAKPLQSSGLYLHLLFSDETNFNEWCWPSSQVKQDGCRARLRFSPLL